MPFSVELMHLSPTPRLGAFSVEIARKRRQVTSAGLDQHLARTWRDRHYDNRGLDVASLLYTKAPQIIRVFDEGGAVRAKRGRGGQSGVSA